MASSSQSSGAFTSGRNEVCVKCGKNTQLWKSRSGRMYNRCPVHVFSHWVEEDETEVQSKEVEDNTTNGLLRRLLESNQALQEEQVTTNRLLRELIEGNKQTTEGINMNKLLVALSCIVVARQNV